MSSLVWLAATATPSPSSTGDVKVDSSLVTPGVPGFVLLFFMALAVYFLGRSMVRRVQGVNNRARLQEEERAAAAREDAERDATPSDETHRGGADHA